MAVSNALEPTTAHRLLHRVAAGQVAGRTPSFFAAIARDGELVWAAGRGTLDNGAVPTADTQYRIGSLTKTFTAVLILGLRDEGRLDLGDRIAAHLPDLALGDITIAQLLSHTAGLASETPPPWWERVSGDVRPRLADVLGGPVGPPGRHFHYSNAGFAILGGLAATLRGRGWMDLVRAEILEPAGMTRTSAMPHPPHASGWAVHPWADVLLPEPTPDTGHMAPAGQLWSTATDLANYAQVLLGNRADILAPETAEQMRRPASPPTDRAWHEGQGLGLQLERVRGRQLFGHLGTMPGFTCACWISADEGLAGVAFGNATGSPQNVSAVAVDLIDIVADAQPRIPPAWTAAPDHDPGLLELTGLWFWGASPVALRLCADRELVLSGVDPGPGATRFCAQADGTWRGVDGDHRGETLRIVRTADGGVSHLDVGSFVFTRAPYEAGRPIPGDVDPGGWR